jgi:hypothetical protein
MVIDKKGDHNKTIVHRRQSIKHIEQSHLIDNRTGGLKLHQPLLYAAK